jgi:hypothetical protein
LQQAQNPKEAGGLKKSAVKVGVIPKLWCIAATADDEIIRSSIITN